MRSFQKKLMNHPLGSFCLKKMMMEYSIEIRVLNDENKTRSGVGWFRLDFEQFSDILWNFFFYQLDRITAKKFSL